MPRDLQTGSIILDQQDPLGTPLAESAGLHLLIIAAVGIFMWIHGRSHGAEWGQGLQGAVQATLVSSAPSVPLPQVQKPSENVLATENPSPAPAIEQQQTAPPQDLNAIPLPVKQPDKPKPPPPKPQPQQEQKHPQPAPPQQHRANFGEQAPASQPRSMAQTTGPASPVQVAGGSGFRFPWYVDVITRKVRENWYIQEVDPGTPKGRQVTVTFNIGRDGSPSGVEIANSSGSSTLDTSARRAVQRVESFGPLPPGYNGSSLSVAYTFTYDQNGR